MLKKRLIFTLLAQDGKFQLSRNFKLQTVGDVEWIRENYEFDSIAFAIDELVVLDVSRRPRDPEAFAAVVRELSRHCFMPIAAGGGVRSVDDARRLLNSGADKIVVNTPLFDHPDVVRAISARYGAQCVIASIDYKRAGAAPPQVFTANGERAVETPLEGVIDRALDLGAGELYLNSMTRDGTGQGLDVGVVAGLGAHVNVPLILAGGAGNFRHLSEAISTPGVSAVATANLFNFMSDNLREARNEIVASGTPLATWPASEPGAAW